MLALNQYRVRKHYGIRFRRGSLLFKEDRISENRVRSNLSFASFGNLVFFCKQFGR